MLLSLKVLVKKPPIELTKTVQFNSSSTVDEACALIRERLGDEFNNQEDASRFGLFLGEEDPRKGLWLDASRRLDYFMLRDGDKVEYRSRYRLVQIRTLDGARKTLEVDDNFTIAELMINICSKMGIANYEEYSLIRELDDFEREKTLTLRKGQSIARDQEKLERMKKKLHTDDELNWLDQSKTLRQEGVKEKDVLLLRRKYFFSDQNVDGRDPVQLNLLYVQLKETLLNGTLPLSQEDAVQLAGLQCQIQFGNHDPKKHKMGFLELKEFLPKEYVKLKGIEKMVLKNHLKFCNTSEIDGKVRYTQVCRSLKTYGITFFLVKEKMKGKNKLVPRLLGVNKDAVVRVDEKTKDILKTWPLQMVRRWASSPNTFTLDFGQYQDGTYTVQTTEGQQIAQLIAGYIDIYVKKKKALDHVGIDGEQESALLEDNIAPAHATIIQQAEAPSANYSASSGNIALPGVLRNSGALSVTRGSLSDERLGGAVLTSTFLNSPAQNNFQVHEIGRAQRALISTVKENLDTVRDAREQLDNPAAHSNGNGHAYLAYGGGSDSASRAWRLENMSLSRSNIVSQLGATSAATAQLIAAATNNHPSCHDEDDVDFATMGTAIATIGSHISHIIHDVKTVVQIQQADDELDGNKYEAGDKLLGAARRLADAFADLLRAAQPVGFGPDKTFQNPAAARRAVLEAASRVGEASHEIIYRIQEDSLENSDEIQQYQETLVTLARAVATDTAALVGKAKEVATLTSDPVTQQRVIDCATATGLATSQLVTSTKVLAPTIQQPGCRAQLLAAAAAVAHSVEAVATAATQSQCSEPRLVDELHGAADNVRENLEELEDHISSGLMHGQHDQTVETIIAATDRLFGSVGDGPEMVRQARLLATATSTLINNIKNEAQAHPEPDAQSKLLAATKSLADATSLLVEAARQCAQSPQTMEQQYALRAAAEHLQAVTRAAGAPALRARAIHALQHTSQMAIIAATQVVNTAQNAAKKSRASNYQVTVDCKLVADMIPKLIMAVRGTKRDAADMDAQKELLRSSYDFLQPGEQLVASCRSTIPTVRDANMQSVLHHAVKTLAQSLEESRVALQNASDLLGYYPQDDSEYVDTAQVASYDGEDAVDCSGAVELAQQQLTFTSSSLVGNSAPEDELVQGAHRLQKLAMEEVTRMEIGARQAMLLPLPGENLVECCIAVANACRNIQLHAEQFVEASDRSPRSSESVKYGRTLVDNLVALSSSLRALAAFGGVVSVNTAAATVMSIQEEQLHIAGDLKNVLNAAQALLLVDEGRQQWKSQLADSLAACLNHIPGQRDVEHVLKRMTVRHHQLTVQRLPPTSAAGGRPLSVLHEDLTQAGDSLAARTGDLIQASCAGAGATTGHKFPVAASMFGQAYDSLLDSGLAVASAAEQDSSRIGIVNGLQQVGTCSERMLKLARDVSTEAEMEASNSRQMLQAAARSVTDSINNLLSVCVDGEHSAAAGTAECDAALRMLEACRALLTDPCYPLSSQGYFACLEELTSSTRPAAEAMRSIPSSAQQQDLSTFSDSVHKFAVTFCHVTEVAAQLAYLVAVADPASEHGEPPIIDATALRQLYDGIQDSCNIICDEHTTHQQVLTAASQIAKRTESICNQCRAACARTPIQATKRLLVASAKDIAAATAAIVKSIKALDSEFTPQNRMQCSSSADTLFRAVETLLNSVECRPEFQSRPARIPPTAKLAQEPLCRHSRDTLEAAMGLVRAARQLACDSKAEHVFRGYSQSSAAVSQEIKRLLTCVKESAPGQHECAEGMQQLEQLLRDLEQARLQADIYQQEATRNGSMGAGSSEMHMATVRSAAIGQAEDALRRLEEGANCAFDCLPKLQAAGLDQPERLGHTVVQLVSILHNLFDGIVVLLRSARYISEPGFAEEVSLLGASVCTVLEAAMPCLESVKEAGGNPMASANTKTNMVECNACLREVLDDLSSSIQDLQAKRGSTAVMLDALHNAIVRLEVPYLSNSDKAGQAEDPVVQLPDNVSFVDFQTRLLRQCAEMRRIAQDMASKAGEPDGGAANLGFLSNALTREFEALCEEARGAGGTNAEAANRIRCATRELGQAASRLVQQGGLVQAQPNDPKKVFELAKRAHLVDDKIKELLAALQAGSRGTQACINAASTVSGIIGDLDTVIMFASAGTLNADPAAFTNGEGNGALVFADHRESILKTAKALVEDTKTLVTGAASDQEKLAESAQQAVRTIVNLTEAVKLGAASLGTDQSESQVLLINAVRDVAAAMADLLNATKNACGNPAADPELKHLKSTAKTMVSNVTSLLKTVKTVEDETQRGTRALEACLDALQSELRGYQAAVEDPLMDAELKRSCASGVQHVSNPDDLVRMATPLISATSRVMSAGNSGRQEDIMLAANMSRKALVDLMLACRTTVLMSEGDKSSKSAVRDAGEQCAQAFVHMLQYLLEVTLRPNKATRQELASASRRVAESVAQLNRYAQQLKGDDLVDTSDPTVVAEKELNSAAVSIEAAARKLAQLTPRQPAQAADESLSLDEQILEAAQSIVSATQALVQSAGAAQHELVAQGRARPVSTSESDAEDTGLWSQGLVSAAKLVAAATHTLCESANAVVQGLASEERLVSAAKQVAASTAQLLVACKVKAAPNSVGMRRLQSAGQAVKKATESLVEAAQAQQAAHEATGCHGTEVRLNASMVHNMRQLLMKEEDIIKKEKELHNLRQNVVKMRQEQRRLKPELYADSDDKEQQYVAAGTSISDL